jgi:hypothetical protein
MTTYGCKFFTPMTGRLFGIETMEAADDAAAIAQASSLLAHSIGGSFELWAGERLVHRTKPAPHQGYGTSPIASSSEARNG